MCIVPKSIYRFNIHVMSICRDRKGNPKIHREQQRLHRQSKLEPKVQRGRCHSKLKVTVCDSKRDIDERRRGEKRAGEVREKGRDERGMKERTGQRRGGERRGGEGSVREGKAQEKQSSTEKETVSKMMR